MIVKNEEKDLADCLVSVKNIADEIIVVDTGSTDRTMQIAREFQARVIEKPWPGDFSVARNFSLELATMQWVLVMDADEKLDSTSAAQLKAYLSTTSATGLRFVQRNISSPQDLVGYYDLISTRMWRNNPAIRYEGLIHESAVDSIFRAGGTIDTTSFVIWHSGYARSSVQSGKQRAERNLELLTRMLATSPKDAYIHYQLGITYKQIGNNAEARLHLKNALELNRDDLSADILGEIYMKLAQMALMENLNTDCVQFAEASLRYTPENVTSQYLAALGYMSLGQVNRAYPYFLTIRQAPPGLLNNIDDLETIISFCRSELGIQE
jgi:glycosyltransferase involved in cell wall biosynthesis